MPRHSHCDPPDAGVRSTRGGAGPETEFPPRPAGQTIVALGRLHDDVMGGRRTFATNALCACDMRNCGPRWQPPCDSFPVMNTPLRKVAVVTLLLLTGLFATACNTTRGVGEDLEEAGEEIQDASK
jgi:predicted small secreted protein